MPNQADHDALVVDNDADVRTACADTVAHNSHALIDSARRNVAPNDIGDPRRVRLPALARQSRSKPVSPSRLVPVDPSKSECLEPRRGPGAHVSLIVVTVDDHGSPGVELSCRLAAKGLQRNVDRPGDMFGLVLYSGQHIDELRPVSEKLSEPIPIDLHHRVHQEIGRDLGETVQNDRCHHHEARDDEQRERDVAARHAAGERRATPALTEIQGKARSLPR